MSRFLVVTADNSFFAALVEQPALHLFGNMSRLDEVTFEEGTRADATPEISGVLWDSDIEIPDVLPLCVRSVPVFLVGPRDGAAAVQITEHFAKPLRLGWLIERLTFHMATAPRLKSVQHDFGPYRLDTHKRQIMRRHDGYVIDLTEKETALLHALASRDVVWPRADLLATVWDYAPGVDTRTLETHIYQLRRKLGLEHYDPIESQAMGYRLNRG